MPKYKYLIVGGGMTADAAVAGIRDVDKTGSVGLIGSETQPPYNRPPLTKGLWKDKPLSSIWRKTDMPGVTLHTGRTARKLDPRQKRVTDDQGTEYGYEKLLLATGGTPRRLEFGGDQVIYYRTLADYERLRTLTEKGSNFAVIGGGFIGSEIAAALAMNGKKVSLIIPEEVICSRLFPSDLAEFVNDYYRRKGVDVLTRQRSVGLEAQGNQLILSVANTSTKETKKLTADAVLAGIGILPNTELAQQAGLKVDNGIHVDSGLRTSQPDIFAAGDVANFEDRTLGKRRRVEHEDNANTMGRLAGQSMAGKAVSYDHLPYFYSDLFDLGYEAVGETDSKLETFADWQERFRKGVVYYLSEGRVRGVLLWNVWEQVDAARRLIAERGPFKAADLKGKLPA
ncbi:MAG TPA: FAD/NAD(P)-binding oxidoreductase [Planctomycetaceae bacterium]|jgi:3-phenylpropionate/trans-cinnamate dioxygenase ferredoxin reductase subunit|nr:FAD/NAD(P)-binding oxidoreductase [Planctomycetaceae bacterium]